MKCSMKYRIFWTFIILIPICVSVLILRYGIHPKSVVVIKPSSFENPDSIAEWTYRQLRGRILLAPTMIAGLPQGLAIQSAQVILSSLKKHIERDLKNSETYTETESQRINPFEVIQRNLKIFNESTNTSDKPSTVQAIRLLFVPLRYENETQDDPELKCSQTPDEREKRVNLGCLAAQKAENFQSSKKLKHSEWVASLEQQGAGQFILYYHPPREAGHGEMRENKSAVSNSSNP